MTDQPELTSAELHEQNELIRAAIAAARTQIVDSRVTTEERVYREQLAGEQQRLLTELAVHQAQAQSEKVGLTGVAAMMAHRSAVVEELESAKASATVNEPEPVASSETKDSPVETATVAMPALPAPLTIPAPTVVNK